MSDVSEFTCLPFVHRRLLAQIACSRFSTMKEMDQSALGEPSPFDVRRRSLVDCNASTPPRLPPLTDVRIWAHLALGVIYSTFGQWGTALGCLPCPKKVGNQVGNKTWPIWHACNTSYTWRDFDLRFFAPPNTFMQSRTQASV